jgi:lipoate-protein ligase A
LQHGGILLAQSPYTPLLPGIQELTGRRLTPEETIAAILREFARETGLRLEPTDWTATEQASINRLVTEKYSQESWNRKR